MKDIRKIVSENLNKRYLINEKFEKIFINETNKELQFNETINVLSDLIDEGYSDEEINTVIEEQFDWLKKLMVPGQDTSSTTNKDTSFSTDNIVDKGKSAMGSQFREYLVSTFLGLFGFKGPLASAMATGLADVELRDIVSLFKGGSGCEQSGANVADGVVEGMLSYILASTDSNSMAANLIRNTIGEYLKASNVGETISSYICKIRNK